MAAGVCWRSWRTHALRRRIDVVEARLLLLLCVTVIGCASLLGVTTGTAAFDRERSAAAEQRADRHVARAVVLRDAADPPPWQDESGRVERVPVPVRWTTDKGGHATGDAQVAPGTERGARTSIWLDRRGHVTTAPSGDRDAWAGALSEGVGGAGLVVGFGTLAGLGVHMVCGRRRAAGWETEWGEVEPEWSRRA
ncbi:hypothetical protein [Streptomyces sp. NPDC006288]|uniref:Rv1733c family protein n=1 Tax=unclassified Streptomyces TaxID=2593676 RepID=UPI0033B0FDAF